MLQKNGIIFLLMMAAGFNTNYTVWGHSLTKSVTNKAHKAIQQSWPTSKELETMDINIFQQMVYAKLDDTANRLGNVEGKKDKEGGRRNLSPTSQYKIFLPQACNSGLDAADCSTTLSSLVNVNSGSEIVVDCGMCVTVDYVNGENVTLPLGINIIGKLYFPSSANLVLRTQHIFVQGELVIDPPREMNIVKVLLFGTTNQSFIPHGENVVLCEVLGCDMSRKPIVVAGGKVDIRGLEDPSCPSWVKLKNVSNIEHNFSDSCNELIIDNGDAEMGVSQPFYSTATSFQVIEDGDSNKYFAIQGRTQESNGISGDLPLECFQSITPFLATFRYRLDAATADSAIIRFRYISRTTGGQVVSPYEECPVAADSSSGWVDCNFIIHPSIDFNDASIISFDLSMKNDQTSNLSFDNLSIKTEFSGFSVLHIDEKAASCWKPGDEILITSWLKNADMRLTAKIKSTTLGAIILEENILITVQATEAADPDFAVEVARLSRQVIFEAEADDLTREYKLGGHFIVYYTPELNQMLQGVKLVNFGQQGELGRYPIHFHLSGSVAGSEVSKNVIYNSNQRCVVVHGTHDLDITDNVAFETSGHCFITEDGIETGNTFTRNLGASVRKPVYVIEGENDDSPSIFWITNPQNTFVDNVAAGSEFSGFWFDTRPDVRGPSKSGNEGVHPQSLSPGIFANNTAHSSTTFGIQYYSPGYRPLVEARMEGNIVYRNSLAGHFIHSNANIHIAGGIAAYNYINVQTFRNADITLDRIKIIGFPEVDLAIEKEYGITPCKGSLYGVSLHSWRLEVSSLFLLGLNAIDLDFSQMGSEIGCSELRAFWMDPNQVENAVSDTVNRVSGLTFHDDISRIDFCDVVDAGVTNLLVEDVDGSLGPSNSTGFFVSDKAATTFANGKGCSLVPNSCAYWCESACLRQVGFKVSDAYKTGNIKMVISHAGGSESVAWDHFAYVDSHAQNYNLGFDGRYGIALPEGDFNISFVDNTTKSLTWPSYVRTVLESPPLCSGYAGSVNLVRPEATEERCGNSIKGGSFEDNSYDHWQVADMAMAIVSPGSRGSAYALQVQNGGQSYMIMGQWIDTTCLVADVEYIFEADIRLVDDAGAVILCDPTISNNCPLVHFQLQDYNTETKVTSFYYTIVVGRVASLADSNGWYRMASNFTLSVELSKVSAALVRFQLLRDVDFQIDSVSLTARFDSSHVPILTPTTSPLASAVPTLSVSTAVPSISAPSTRPVQASNIQTEMPTRQSADIFSAPTGAPSNITPTVQSGKPTVLYSSPMPVVTRTSAPSSRFPNPVAGPTFAPTFHYPISVPHDASSLTNATSSSVSPPPLSAAVKNQWASLWLPILSLFVALGVASIIL